MSRPRALLSWSSGKDSAWSLHVLRAQGEVEVVGLLTTLGAESRAVPMHGVPQPLVALQADAAGLPLWPVPLPDPCPNADYEAVMAEACARARAAGVTAIAFGDLFLADIRRYREDRLSGTGLQALFPLWGAPTGPLAREMLAGGLRARVVAAEQRLAQHVGRDWDAAMLAALPGDIDPCGERGEFHTFAWDGPMFARPVPVRSGPAVVRDGFATAALSAA